MNIILTFPDRTISITVFDNAFTKDLEPIWKNKLAADSEWETFRLVAPRAHSWKHPPLAFERKIQEELWSKITAAYYLYVFELEAEAIFLPKEFDGTNKYTNKLHRIFTTAERDHINNNPRLSNVAYQAINVINDRVHELEMYIMNNNKFHHKLNKVEWIEIIPKEIVHYVHGNYDDIVSQEADIYALKQITGKDFITAYFDEDDCNNWDVVNYDILPPGICIDINKSLKKIWKSHRFNKFVRQTGYDGPLGYIPIGNFATKADKEFVIENHATLIKIELD